MIRSKLIDLGGWWQYWNEFWERINSIISEFYKQFKPIVSLESSHNYIYRGQGSRLYWESWREVDTLEINQGIGPVRIPSGSQIITPTQTTHYTITATNRYGSHQAHQSISVQEPPSSEEYVEIYSTHSDPTNPPEGNKYTYTRRLLNPRQAQNADLVARITKVVNPSLRSFTLTHIDARGNKTADVQIEGNQTIHDPFKGRTVEGEWTAVYIHQNSDIQTPATIPIRIFWTTYP